MRITRSLAARVACRVLIASVVMGAVAAGPAQAGELLLTITGLRSTDGVVRVALFDRPEAFPRGEPVMDLIVPAEPDAVVAAFPMLPAGIYAVAFYHDENDNHTFDRSSLGLPLEGYGFSNDAPVYLSPPSFNSAAVEFDGTERLISARMRY
jgi:uncharacterized protein (DUF2141 family)